ncbi:MAG: hypothetical protein WAJ93_15400 [Candidatus Nitrosopolaris sp.]
MRRSIAITIKGEPNNFDISLTTGQWKKWWSPKYGSTTYISLDSSWAIALSDIVVLFGIRIIKLSYQHVQPQ